MAPSRSGATMPSALARLQMEFVPGCRTIAPPLGCDPCSVERETTWRPEVVKNAQQIGATALIGSEGRN